VIANLAEKFYHRFRGIIASYYKLKVTKVTQKSYPRFSHASFLEKLGKIHPKK